MAICAVNLIGFYIEYCTIYVTGFAKCGLIHTRIQFVDHKGIYVIQLFFHLQLEIWYQNSFYHYIYMREKFALIAYSHSKLSLFKVE